MNRNLRFISIIFAVFTVVTGCAEEESSTGVVVGVPDNNTGDAFSGGQYTGGGTPEFPSSTEGETNKPLTTDCSQYAGVGCPCTTGGDCAEGFCLPTADGMACTAPCEAGTCPDDWLCQSLDESLCPGGCPPLCVPLGVYICNPCEKKSDCKNPYSTGGLAGATDCITFNDAGSFCSIGCATAEDCPTGYICGSVETVAGEQALKCIPQDNTCECSNLAITEGASTSCTPIAPGTPGCEGTRFCDVSGLSACVAEPQAEVCDNLDNDCDGVKDDGACGAGESCECGSGTCKCVCDLPEGCAGGGETTSEESGGGSTESGGGTDGDCVVNGTTVAEGATVNCQSDCGTGTQTCVNGTLTQCSTPNGIQCMDFVTCSMVTLCEDTCPPVPQEVCNGLDENCDGKDDETFTCSVGQTETKSCPGSCGTESRTCNGNCNWGPWSGCAGGTCVPGETESQTQACGNCGSQSRSRTCTDGCSWGSWSAWSSCSGQGTCSPGATEDCDVKGCKQKVCNNQCKWGSCGLAPGAQCDWEEGTNFQCCGSKSWQFCSPQCQWYSCQSCAGTSCGCP